MIKELLQEGFILKSKGYYKHAIESFYKALEYDNTSSELMSEIAQCYYLMGEEERALNYIEQTLKNNPTHIESLKLLKEIFIDKQALDKAEQTAKNIYCISHKTEDLVEIFKLLNKQKKYKEIFEYSFEEESYTLYYELAYAKLFMNELDDAKNYINKSLELKKDDTTLLLKGKILFKMNRQDECVELVKALKYDENNADMIHFMGLVKQYECDFATAIKYFLQALKLEPKNDLYHYDCASTYFKMEETHQAKKHYNLAISINPDNPNYHFALANLYYSEKHYKRALEELNYDFFEAKLLKAIILYDSGYIALAKKEFDTLSTEYKNNELIQQYKLKIVDELRI